MKTALYTLSVGHRPWLKNSQKWQRLYAKRIGADYICQREISNFLKKLPFTTEKLRYQSAKLDVYQLYERYERVIIADDTCFISPLMPNLFDQVPSEELGVVLAPVTPRIAPYMDLIKGLYGTTLPHDRFFNSGFLVTSRHHKILYENVNYAPVLYDGAFPDQTYLSMVAYQKKIKLHCLTDAYNFTGTQIKKLTKPSIKIYNYHLTSMLSTDERTLWGKKLDNFFKSLL